MRTFNYVVTHPGNTHRDEFLALGILAHAGAIGEETPILRREPTPKELEDPDVAVVDVGNVYDHSLGNYDHHGMPREIAECAMSLVAASYRIPGRTETYQELLGEKPWYVFTTWLDSQGPKKAASKFGLSELPTALRSPLEHAVLSAFESGDLGMDTVVDLARMTIGRKVADAVQLRDQIEFFEQHASRAVVHGINCLIIPSDNTFGSEQYRKQQAEAGVVYAVCLSYDNRGNGWSLYRFDDHPSVDFSKLGPEPCISFAHASGFIAKTKERLPVSDLLDLVALAITPQ